MNKKLTSPLKLMISFVLAAILCLSLASPAFATEQGPITGDHNTPAKAALTKILKMPVGTNTPTAAFTFEIYKKSLDGVLASGNSTITNLMPNIGTTAVGSPVVTHYTKSSGNFSSSDPAIESGGIKLVPKEVMLFDENITWKQAGIYVYTIKETQALVAPFSDTFQDQITYWSPAVYEVTVLVDNHPTIPGQYYIAAIAAKIVVIDNNGQTADKKVDPTPIGGNSTTVISNYSKMVFTNNYLKNNGGTDPTNQNKVVLAVSKNVTGVGANQTDLYFPFQVKVKNPETITDANKTYKAYILTTSTNTVVNKPALLDNTVTGNIKTDTSSRDYIEFKTNITLTVNLKHGQSLAFIDLPVGTEFEVNEALTTGSGYTPAYTYILNGAAPQSVNGTSETAHAFPADTVNPNKVDTARIGEAKSSVAYTNAKNTTAITGVSVNDLPFIILIVVVALAITGYAVIKFRRNAKYNR